MASFGRISGLNLRAAFMFPLIFIFPCNHVIRLFITYLHECLLWLELALAEVDKIVIEHDKSSIWLDSINLSHFHLSVSILKVEGDKDWLVSLLFSQLEGVDSLNFWHDLSTRFLEVRSHFLKDCGGFKTHV